MSVRLFKSLLFKSTHIQQEIEREQTKTWPDRWRLLKLKKIRLSIKDRMERVIHYGMAGETARLQTARITMPARRTAHNN